jgi:DNA replication and repair protein RecF
VKRALLQALHLRDFRNLARLDLDLPDDGIAIVGENGQGKSNLLEAIYYLNLLRSARGARDQDVVRFGAAGFHVSARVDTGRAREIAVGFARAGKRKKVTLDGGVPERLSDALGALPSVMFSPGDVELVAGAPSARRRYLDVMLALSSRPYLLALQRYRGALAHRNAALRAALRTGARGAAAEAKVAVWEPPLAEHGAVLWAERLAWVATVGERFATRCAEIGEAAPVRLRYVSATAGDDEADSREALHGTLERALAARRGHDLRRGLTHAGPHRDDLLITLAGPEGTHRELRTFGSAGQQRTAAIVLRMLEAETLRDHGGREPLFLLDDPFAELDVRRAGRIIDLLAAEGLGQSVLVVPRESDIPPGLTRLERWRIADGRLSAWDGGR